MKRKREKWHYICATPILHMLILIDNSVSSNALNAPAYCSDSMLHHEPPVACQATTKVSVVGTLNHCCIALLL